jgi:hypothetical protein
MVKKMTYNTRIEELNKKLHQPCKIEDRGEPCYWCINIRQLIWQLDSLRSEAISKVRELQIPIIGLEGDITEEIKRRKAVIDYLKTEWNISEVDKK